MQKAYGRATWNWRALLIVWLLATLIIAAIPQSGARIVVDVEAGFAGVAQLFYDRGTGYSETESVVYPYHAGRTTLVFPLPTGNYRSVRFDPTTNANVVVLRNMRLVRGNDEAVPLRIPEAKPVNIAAVELRDDGYAVTPVPGAVDPQFVLEKAFEIAPAVMWTNSAFLALLIVLGLVVLYEVSTSAFSSRGFIGTLTIAVVALALCLAIATGQRLNDHPDEYSHYMALRFYVDHGLLPPSVRDPRTISSVSVWGFSYLFEIDVVYPLTALVLRLVGYGPEVIVPGMRLFNVGLLLLLGLAALRSRATAAAVAVVLLSPQVWYVFSYYNADSLPLTAAILLAAWVANEDGDVARYLRGEPHRRSRLALFVLVAAVLLCSKRNYLPVLPMLGAWLAVRHGGLRLTSSILVVIGLATLGFGAFLGTPMMGGPLPGATVAKLAGLALLAVAALLWWRTLRGEAVMRKAMLRFMLLAALGAGVAAPRYAWDYWQDGAPGTKAAAMIEVSERLAGEKFKPSNFQSPDRYNFLTPIRNNVGLWEMMTKWGWARLTMQSSFGYYGHFTVPAPLWTIFALAALAIAFFSLGGVAVRRRFPEQWRELGVVSLGGGLLVVWASLSNTWVNTFNPQGRYLFPALVLLVLPMVAAYREVPRGWYRALLLTSAAISAYSFVSVIFATTVAA